jgi:hypothetical protein
MKFTHTKYLPPEKTSVLEAGDYPFKIIKAEEKISQSGNPMIEIYVLLNAGGSATGRSNDWLLDKEGSTRKRKHLLYAINKGHLWKNHELRPSDLIGSVGKCTVTKEKKDKNDPANLTMINKITDYICDDSIKVPDEEETIQTENKAHNDDIPF